MPGHAGFAASVAIRQQVLQEMLRVLYHAGQIPHRLVGSQGASSADLFLELPQVLFRSDSGGRLILDLNARGPLTVALPDQPAETRSVRMRGRVSVPPRLELRGGAIQFGVDAATSTLDSLEVEVLAGGPFPPLVQAIAGGPLLRALLQQTLRDQLSKLERLAPPFDLSFLGPIATAPGTRVTPAVRDGVLVLGIDVENAEGVTTHGQAAALTDTTAGHDIAMWTNPAALPILFGEARGMVKQAAKAQGATLESLAFGQKEGAYEVSCRASIPGKGAANLALDLEPRLGNPDPRARQELWFEVTNVETEVERPWWAVLLDVLGVVLTAGILTAVIESLVGSVRSEIVGAVMGQKVALSPLVHEFTFAGTSGPRFLLRIEAYECHADGSFAAMALRPQIPAAGVEGPRWLSMDEAAYAEVVYRIVLPFDDPADDPALRVRWQVRRTDTNEVVRTDDGPAQRMMALDLTRHPVLLGAKRLRIECRVYRTIGPRADEVYDETVFVEIHDRLDRSHPYVRWRHEVVVPVVQVEPSGAHTVLGYDHPVRRSAIHRTDVPGRCRMASRYSKKASRWPGTLGRLEYLDELPFPRDELVARRAEVCDYCFFGGPDKTTPLV